MENVDIYNAAEVLAEQYPNDDLSIAYLVYTEGLIYIDNDEKLAAANALIARYSH